MGNNSENKPDRYINIGIVAHGMPERRHCQKACSIMPEQSGSLAEWIIKMRF